MSLRGAPGDGPVEPGWSKATYEVLLWDHDPDDGSVPGFSRELAETFAGKMPFGRVAGLRIREVVKTVYELYAYGWSEVSVLVQREGVG